MPACSPARSTVPFCVQTGRRWVTQAAVLFAPDAWVQIAHYPEWSGQDTIHRGLQQTFAGSGFLHQRCDIGLIDVAGDRANARLSIFEAHRLKEEADLSLVFGIYEDEYVRLADHWRFQRRRYSMQFRGWTPIAKSEQLAPPALQMLFLT